MLKLIIGLKGSGKTKQLIGLVNEALDTTTGSVVVIEKGIKLRYDIKYTARLVNTNDYLVFDGQSLFGLIAGIIASNSDVTDIFVDSALKICDQDVAAFERLLLAVDELAEKHNVKVVMTSSLAEDAASDVVKKYL